MEFEPLALEEKKVALLVETDLEIAAELESLEQAKLHDLSIGGIGFDIGRQVSRQPEEDCPVGRMPSAGKPERAVKSYLDPRDRKFREALCEIGRGDHWPHGV